MALQAVKHGFPFPAWPTSVSGAPSLAAILIDAATEKSAAIWSASAAKAIRTIHLRTGVVTTGDTVDVRVETVDAAANGDPTGTLWTTNSNAALVIDSADDSVWKSVQLTADTAALAIGNVFACVVANGSGGGNINLASYADHGSGSPYGSHFTSAWAKTTPPLIIPQYSDGSFEPVFGFVDTGGPLNVTIFNSSSTTNRRGNIFQVPFPCRVKGCWAWVDADGDFTVKLYDSDGTSVLATTANMSRFQRVGATGNIAFIPFTATATLAATTNYRIVVVPADTTNLTTYDFDVPVAAMLDMFPGGQTCHASVFTSSAWVETTTRRGYLGVFIDAFSDGIGSGGGAAQLVNSGALIG